MTNPTTSPRRLLVWLSVIGAASTGAVLSTSTATGAGTEQISRVSVSSTGGQRNVEAGWPSISADGRFVAFCSGRPSFENGKMLVDTFLRDRLAGTTELVSVSRTGTRGNRRSCEGPPSVSQDGRYVAFASLASNLIKHDTNGVLDVFVRDRLEGRTRRVSKASNGHQSDNASQNPALSANGRVVAFQSLASNLVRDDTNNSNDVFIHNLSTGMTRLMSKRSNESHGGVANSYHPAISAKGRYVAFSSASPLVRGDTNRRGDVYVRDRHLGTTRRVSITSDEQQSRKGFSGESLAISPHGRYVAFSSDANDLVPGDTNKTSDVFLRDRLAGTTERISVTTTGEQGDDYSYMPAISRKGRYVAFASWSPKLSGQSIELSNYHIFVRDRRTGTTRILTVNSSQEVGNGFSEAPTISSDGLTVAFTSGATNLVTDDTNNHTDVFVHVTIP